MHEYKVVEVTTRKQSMMFIEFPDELYKDCKQYVPALHREQIYSLTKVSSLKYCSRKMWMVLDYGTGSKGKVVGRICGMINPRYNEKYGTKRARFGWFDTINDIEVAGLLVGTAERWAEEQGMNEIHGPLYYNTLGKQGMLVETNLSKVPNELSFQAEKLTDKLQKPYQVYIAVNTLYTATDVYAVENVNYLSQRRLYALGLVFVTLGIILMGISLCYLVAFCGHSENENGIRLNSLFDFIPFEVKILLLIFVVVI